MHRVLTVDIFGEDHAHESLVTALVKRVALEENIPVLCQTRSVRGGHPRAIHEFRLYQQILTKRPGTAAPPDLIVVTMDSNCTGFAARRKEVRDATREEFTHVVVPACPEPHIERWFLADPDSFHGVVGARPTVGRKKCDRDHYKNILHNTIREVGHPVRLGGSEWATELVEAMNLYRAGKADASFKAFVDDFRSALKAQEN